MMKKRPSTPNCTPWFSASTPPVRDGIYQVKLMPSWNWIRMRWSNGRWWWPCADFNKKPLETLLRGWLKTMVWRGRLTP